MTISIDSSTKKKAEQLKKSTGYDMSEIIQLLLNGATEDEILDLYKASKSKK